MVSAGAPVFDHSGECVAAVSVAGPIMRMPPNDLDRFVRLVVATAAEVSTAMGGSACQLGGVDDEPVGQGAGNRHSRAG